MNRYAMVARVRPGKLAEYCELHAAVWPGVLRMIGGCSIRNYSIHATRLPDGRDYLFSYFEYVGSDFAADMRKMAADEETQRWWAVCKQLLEPVADLAPGEVWSLLEEVFYCE
jgi:L-rhamnose mutarotase